MVSRTKMSLGRINSNLDIAEDKLRELEDSSRRHPDETREKVTRKRPNKPGDNSKQSNVGNRVPRGEGTVTAPQ